MRYLNFSTSKPLVNKLQNQASDTFSADYNNTPAKSNPNFSDTSPG